MLDSHHSYQLQSLLAFAASSAAAAVIEYFLAEKWEGRTFPYLLLAHSSSPHLLLNATEGCHIAFFALGIAYQGYHLRTVSKILSDMEDSMRLKR